MLECHHDLPLDATKARWVQAGKPGSDNSTVVGEWEKRCISAITVFQGWPFISLLCALSIKSGSHFNDVWGRRARFLAFIVVDLL